MFRFVDPAVQVQSQAAPRALTLLADQDFAPWSFVAEDGSVKGISVDLALSACNKMGVACRVKPLPFQDLQPGLLRQEGDVIVAGLKPSAALLDQLAMTRSYFRSFGRFVVRTGSPLQGTDIRAMAGRRLGFVEGTSHAAWLKRYYSRSALSGFGSFDEMGEALRTGNIEAAFGDAVQLAFWLKGSRSKNCCTALGKAYIDTDTFSRNLVLWVRKSDKPLSDALDASLDKLEEDGTTQQVFSSYLPGSIW